MWRLPVVNFGLNDAICGLDIIHCPALLIITWIWLLDDCIFRLRQ